MDESSKYIDTYRQEAEEYLSEIEDIVLDMEQNPDDKEGINRLFRAIHTIKGSGAMFGFDDIAGFTHHVETVLNEVREGVVPVSTELINLILASRDQIKAMFDATLGGAEVDPEVSSGIITALENLLPKTKASEEEFKTVSQDTQKKEMTYRVRFHPHSDIFASGTDPALLLREIQDLGKCNIIAHTRDIPLLKAFNPELCYLHWNLILTTSEGIDAIRDVFIFVEDNCELKIEVIGEEGLSEDEAEHKKIGEILIDRGELSSDDLRKALEVQKRVGDILLEAEAVDQEAVDSALIEQQHVRDITKKRCQAISASSVRVAADKLDRLINLVGELVITQARLSQVARSLDEIEIENPVEEVERLTGELRDCALNMRMLPIGTTFSKFRRLVRDLSADLGKEIDLITEGGETGLDKTVIERLNDPLVHLIRNSIDHGIRSPEERERLGKPRKGTIRLTAAHQGARVVLTIEDDGMGIDPEIIRAKAVERGIISKKTELSEENIFPLIFTPGFSTSEQVTNVSGRGVGMDVVKREIDSLGGSVKIASEKGRYLRISMFLPLTLAIIDGLLVDVGGDTFVLPLPQIEECAELTKSLIEKSHGRNMILMRDELIPFIRLREVFAISSAEEPPLEHIAIVQSENFRVGIVVDEIIDKIQTVIKSLDRNCQNAEGISGATIMGDGRVALILDIRGLIRCANREEEARVFVNASKK